GGAGGGPGPRCDPPPEAPGAAPPAGERGPGRGRRRRLPRLRRRTWALIAVAVILAGAVTGYVAAAAVAAPLQFAGASSWWYARDSARAVDTSADGAEQTTVPIRSGQRQGFVVSIYNPTPWTQTVLGLPAGYLGLGGPGPQARRARGPNNRRGGGGLRP